MIMAIGRAIWLCGMIFICGAMLTIYEVLPAAALLPLLPHILVHFEL